jgi:hypothetical protein
MLLSRPSLRPAAGRGDQVTAFTFPQALRYLVRQARNDRSADSGHAVILSDETRLAKDNTCIMSPE